jgi:hypothetical protein
LNTLNVAVATNAEWAERLGIPVLLLSLVLSLLERSASLLILLLVSTLGIATTIFVLSW